MITAATWNINSIKARQDNVLHWLADTRPDLVLLQEIKCTTDSFPVQVFADAGYHAVVHGQPSYNGVAILSREPVELISHYLPDPEGIADEQARFMDVLWKGVRFINIYAPNGNTPNTPPIGTEKYAYKLRWMERLRAYIAPLLADRQPFLIGGDFNIIPEDIDARTPDEWLDDALYQLPSRQEWRALKNMGLTDAFRAVHGNVPRSYSFWDYQAGCWPRDNGIRIDHFLLSPSLTDKMQDCVIDKNPRGKEKPSDHTPVIVTLDL